MTSGVRRDDSDTIFLRSYVQAQFLLTLEE
jgi:hypothetical protein